MSHKVHPKAYRLKEMADWNSRGFYGKKALKYLKEDFEIREFLKKRFKDCALEKIEVERFPNKINIIIHSARPAFIIGRGGKNIELLREKLKHKILKKDAQALNLEIKEIKDPWTKAALAAQWIAASLERRIRYRRSLKQALEKIMAHKEIKGARVEVAGRLNGVSISRTEWLQAGRLPRQTLRADIDYGTAQAFCTYGVIGVKVWIYKGDKF